jgi:hypothetical protein
MMLEPELAPPLDDAETTARWMNALLRSASCWPRAVYVAAPPL